MNKRNREICLKTILTLVMAAGAVGIGYTNFVQAELKEDVTYNKDNIDLMREKLTSIQVQLAKIDQKLETQLNNGLEP